MKTYLGEKNETKEGFVIQQVLNIDEIVGKTIKTNEDFNVIVGIEPHSKKLLEMNIKDLDIKVEDIIRDCGLQIYCKTTNDDFFAILPSDLEKFEEVSFKI